MDTVGLIRVAKHQVRLATAGLDRDGVIGDYLAEIHVRLTRHKGMTAGWFSSAGVGDVGYVTMNIGVCYTEDRFMSTLIHELAHAVCHYVHGEEADSHGRLWKQIMVQLGQKPERCHNYKDRR